MPKYIIYALKPGEEYVLGVHPWVLYPDAKSACDAIIQQVLPGYSAKIDNAFTTDKHYIIYQHKLVVRDNDATGYVARVG
jgi:hypothetical protein